MKYSNHSYLPSSFDSYPEVAEHDKQNKKIIVEERHPLAALSINMLTNNLEVLLLKSFLDCIPLPLAEFPVQASCERPCVGVLA